MDHIVANVAGAACIASNEKADGGSPLRPGGLAPAMGPAPFVLVSHENSARDTLIYSSLR